MTIKLPVIYSQLEPSYKDLLLGFNTDKTFNMYDFGCLVVCLAQISSYYGDVKTPLEMNDRLKENGGFVNGGDYVWGTLGRIGPATGETRTATPQELTDAQISEIRGALDQGYPVVIELDYNPKTVQKESHYVTLVGYNPQDENDFTIVDPLGGVTRSLKSYLAFFKPSARKTIEQYIIYAGPVPQPVVEQPPEQPAIPQPTEPAPVQPVAALPENYENVVKKATQFDSVVSYLEIPKRPEDTMFDDVRRVVAGIKSRVTDLENKKIAAEDELAKATALAKTQEIQISNLKQDLLSKDKVHLAQVESIKSSQPDLSKVQASYEAALISKEEQIGALLEENYELRADLNTANSHAEHESQQQTVAVSYNESSIKRLFASIVDFFTRINVPKTDL